MSRWSAEPLRIALAPGEAALLRRSDSSAGRVLATDDPAPTSLLPLLDEALADPAWRGRSVEVVLSQHFVRHVLTLPPGKTLSRMEERTLASAGLREIYGDLVDRWEVRVISQPPQFGLVGAALDAAFAHELDALLARHGFRNPALRPLGSFAARHLPPRFAGWWALAEPGWLTLFGGADGIWHHLAGQPVGDDWAEALPDLVAREAGLAALPLPASIWIQGVGMGAVLAPDSGDAHWDVLPHDASARGALALAGI
ncbi:MAG: hypothetical protein M0Z73_10205 [Betaproteobacteria bacterium]|nr:hypothetical protein [Betaproteobacteria bacterium]